LIVLCVVLPERKVEWTWRGRQVEISVNDNPPPFAGVNAVAERCTLWLLLSAVQAGIILIAEMTGGGEGFQSSI
jgi:hypothetical protein